jgi:hydrogenase maturation protease
MIIRVLGIGDVLMTDEGFGPRVVAYLRAMYSFPESVELIEAEALESNVASGVGPLQALIIVGVVDATGSAGELRAYRKSDILGRGSGPRDRPNVPWLKEWLNSAGLAGTTPAEVLLVGATPGSVEPGSQLTPPLRAAVPHAARIVVAELARLGAPPQPRDTARAPARWWTLDPAGALAT